MNLNQLEYFVCAAETLNFSRAAERCYITQTAMSQQIRALEGIVGVPLFNRSNHKVELTQAGKVYLNEARAILERASEAIRLTKAAASGVEGSIAIGYNRGYGQAELAEEIKSFREKNPGIKIFLYRDNTSILLDKLETGDCDVLFTIAPHSWNKYPNIRHKVIHSYQLMVVMPKEHWLSSRTSLRYSDLSEEKFIMMQPTGRPNDEMEESLLIYEKGGFLPDIVALYQDPEEILLGVSAGMGISLLPEFMIRRYSDTQDVRIVPLYNDDKEYLDVELAWKDDNANISLSKLLSMFL